MNANAREVFVSNLKYWMKKRNKEQADYTQKNGPTVNP